jgi:ethanolamine transporter EutH
MKKIYLIVRLIVEAIVGTICLFDLPMLPGIWKDKDHPARALGELFVAIIVIILGVLFLKDAVTIGRRLLKASRVNSPSI